MTTIKITKDSIVEFGGIFYKFDIQTQYPIDPPLHNIILREIKDPNPMPKLEVGMQLQTINGSNGVFIKFEPDDMYWFFDTTRKSLVWIEKQGITKLWDYKTDCIWQKNDR